MPFELDLALLVFPVVAGHADGIHQPDVQFAGDDGRRHQPAAGHGDDAFEEILVQEPPGQGLGIAVQLFPGDGIGALVGV
jgi:hypothetical protein